MKIPTSVNQAAEISTRSTVKDVLAFFWKEKGIAPPTKEELDNVPPWTEEEADAFERNINEAFEQIEDEDTFP